ncbi:hypothetical protein OC846_005958 [Tilletia horrida]|uniref:ABC transporter domain-containing protein n=1 Tax=Tilletia horrida TaxID=155126 RepID=A0AAN6GMJ4_9BASI|nr:hypothetical protein OC846_005958 [Tilletia horrida]
MVDIKDLLATLPSIILQTLTALKTLPKLEQALQTYIAAPPPRDVAQLEKSVKPILLDAGLGKKSAVETVQAWAASIESTSGSTEKETVQTSQPAQAEDPPVLSENVAAPPQPEPQNDTKPSDTAQHPKRKAGKKQQQRDSSPEAEVSKLSTMLADSAITATSQETRFSIDAIEHASLELDLKLVTIAIAGRELITDAHLRVKGGVHYGLVARNGEGKSTLMRAMADGLIPGLPPHLKIQLVSQLEADSIATGHGSADEESLSVIDVVLASDKVRDRSEREMKILSAALEAGSEEAAREAVLQIELLRVKDELDDARRLALRRSRARGQAARQHLIQMEAKYEEAKAVYASKSDSDRDFTSAATDMSADLGTKLTVMDASSAPARARQILRGLGFSDERIDSPYTTLSGGWRSRASLASALTQQAHILLLDEPVNYLDLPAVMFLQRFIRDRETAVVTVSHDREFLDNIAEELIILRKQKLTYFAGNLTEYETTTWRTRKNLLKQKDALDKKKEHIEKSIQTLHQSGDDKKLKLAKSRQKKLDDRWGVERSAKGGRFKLPFARNHCVKINRDYGVYSLTSRAALHIEELDKPIHFTFPDPAPLRYPGALAHLEKVTFAYPNTKQPVVQDISLTIDAGERVALVGPNGHGKSTIVNLVVGNLTAQRGTTSQHPRARIGLYAQHTIEELTSGEATNSNQTALAHFLAHIASSSNAAATGMDENRARAFLGQLGLHGRTADTLPVRMLSGGQKVRLGLAKVFCSAPDLVVLDEVTTHLDGDTIDALIDALRIYDGAILLVTHDRHACKRIVEGAKRPRLDDEDGDDSEDDSEEDDAADLASASGPAQKRKVGRTYLVENGRMKLLDGGMNQYASRVEREVERDLA